MGKYWEAIPAHWRQPLLRLCLVWAALGLATHSAIAEMFHQWWDIDSYNHILLVPLIIAWLIHGRIAGLATLKPAAYWPGFAALFGAMLVWFLGSVAGVNSLSALGTVLAFNAAVLAILGPRVAIACAFPMCYSIFLVPFGGELVPALQWVTTEIVILLTHLSGIEATVDGVFIGTPAGLFEVAEGCSGANFFVAMFMLGTLICYVCYSKWQSRVLFMLSALSLSVLANGIRAFGTVYMAQHIGAEKAAGFDHIIYGWIFFAVVLFGLLAAAWRTFDRDPEDIGIDFPELVNSPMIERASAHSPRPMWQFAALALIILPLSVWAHAAAGLQAKVPEHFALPQVEGWAMRAEKPQVAWMPKMTGADRKIFRTFTDDKGRKIDVVLGLYTAQKNGQEAGGVGQGALIPESHWSWVAPWNAPTPGLGEEMMAYGNHKRFALTNHRVGGKLMASRGDLKLAATWQRLTLQEKPVFTLILSVEGVKREEADKITADFTASVGDLGAWIDRAASLR